MSRANIMQAVLDDMRPWKVEHEDAAMLAWRKVKSLTPEIARQEPRAIAEMIEHLIELKGGR